MKRLSLMAIIKVKPDKVDLVKSEMMKLIPLTRKEKGCIKYDLLNDNNDHTRFVFEETWESYEDLKNHLKSDHIASYSKVTKDFIESKEFIELTKLDL